MKNRNINKFLKPVIMTGILGVTSFSCTDLQDVALDKVTDASSISPDQLLGAAYNQLGSITDQANTFALHEHSTDEMQGPTRGTDWDDNGRWRNIHTHTWTGTSADVVGAWNGLNKGHALSNEAIFNARGDQSIVAQGTFLRAWFMFHIMDLFGQVPFKTLESDGTVTLSVLSRTEAASKIISDLESVMGNLPASTGTNTGKATKEAAQALLAKVYLNRGVYNADPNSPEGPYTFSGADLDKVISNCDAIINSGKFAMDDDYFTTFSPENTEKSKELVFAIANDKGQSVNNGSSVRNRYYMTTHYNQNPSGWNGFTTLADFYNGFEAGDKRLGGGKANASASGLVLGFEIGQQYNQSGAKLTDRQGTDLVYTLDCPLNGANERQGVRVIKYYPQFPEIDAPANDYILIRYSDVVLMKAEAMLRKGDAAGGLALVNTLRAKRGLADLASLTPTNMLAERAHELYWEGWRRNDLIRFGKFNDPVVNRSAKSDGYRVLYPIPQKEIEVNPKLTQNKGY